MDSLNSAILVFFHPWIHFWLTILLLNSTALNDTQRWFSAQQLVESIVFHSNQSNKPTDREILEETLPIFEFKHWAHKFSGHDFGNLSSENHHGLDSHSVWEFRQFILSEKFIRVLLSQNEVPWNRFWQGSSSKRLENRSLASPKPPIGNYLRLRTLVELQR